MGFWVGDNSKNTSKSGGLFKETPKNWTFHITWGSIQEWGSIRADTVAEYEQEILCSLLDGVVS